MPDYLCTFVGVKILEGVGVESIGTTNNVVTSVTTSKGRIACEIFVNCTGQVCCVRSILRQI